MPSTAANTTEFWSAETFDEKTIDRELGWGAGLGFNSCRVFVQYLVWKHDPAGLKQRLDKFLALADQHGLTTTLVLFDDCAFGDPPQTEPYLGKQRDPIPGMILPSWTPSPGHKTLADQDAWPDLEKYVKDIVGTFRAGQAGADVGPLQRTVAFAAAGGGHVRLGARGESFPAAHHGTLGRAG